MKECIKQFKCLDLEVDCDEIGATGEIFFGGYPMYSVDDVLNLSSHEIKKELSKEIKESHEILIVMMSISDIIQLVILCADLFSRWVIWHVITSAVLRTRSV